MPLPLVYSTRKTRMASADTPLLSDRFAQALTYAHQLHQTQARKGSEIPYISHLLAVAALVLEDGGDEDQRSLPFCMMQSKTKAA